MDSAQFCILSCFSLPKNLQTKLTHFSTNSTRHSNSTKPKVNMLHIVLLCVFMANVFGGGRRVDIEVKCDRLDAEGDENDFKSRGEMYAYCLDENGDELYKDESPEWECDGHDITGDAQFSMNQCYKIEVRITISFIM